MGKKLAMQIKPDTSSGDAATARESNIKLRCGDCMHFKGTAHPIYGQPCAENGVRAGATAPSCYTPNMSLFRNISPEAVQTLATMVSGMTAQQQRITMGLFRSASSLERMNLKFLQTVYFSMGGDCLQNYYRGYVFSAGPEKNTVIVVGQDYIKAHSTACVAQLLRESVITSKKKFNAIKNRLIEAGQLTRLPPKVQAQIIKDDYEPPTFETSPEQLEARANKSSKRKPKKDNDGKMFKIDEAAL